MSPRYDFTCNSCGKTFERYYPVNDKPIATAHCSHRITAWPIISPVSFKMDKGRHYSVAFGKEFKNEKDLKDYAKFHGHIPLENASTESIRKWDRSAEEEKQKKLYESLSEPIEWGEYGGGSH